MQASLVGSHPLVSLSSDSWFDVLISVSLVVDGAKDILVEVDA